MKVNIGKHKNWFGPYQLAELLCFWVKDIEDEHGFKNKPDWVHDFGDWLAHGNHPNNKPFFEGMRHTTWLYKFLLWVDRKKPSRKIKVKIESEDLWSLDQTLALVILPALKKFKENKHGAPKVDDNDVPEELRSTAAPPTKNEWDTDENYFKRWDYVLDEMIFAFEHKIDDSWEYAFTTGDCDFYTEQTEDGFYEIKRGPNHTAKTDYEGMRAVYARITNGFRLFGKYYEALWI